MRCLLVSSSICLQSQIINRFLQFIILLSWTSQFHSCFDFTQWANPDSIYVILFRFMCLDFTQIRFHRHIDLFIDFTVYRFSDSLSISQFIDFTDFTIYRFSDNERLLILHRHIDLFLDFLIQLQHKFWQPNVPQDSITTVFNYSRIQLHSSALQPTKQGLSVFRRIVFVHCVIWYTL